MVNNSNDRYSRQILFSEIGQVGQARLDSSKVLLIGCGALGSNIANFLVRAGVGELQIIDRDFLELNNLQRQMLFDEDDVRHRIPKAIAAMNKLNKVNSTVKIKAFVCDINPKNVEEMIRDVDIIMDGTDNMETRFLLNDACIKTAIPWIYGGVIGSIGMTMNIIPNEGPCLRCFIDKIPAPGTLPTCDTFGVINTIPALIASIQATEAIKILTSSKGVNRDLTYIDIWNREFLNLKVVQAEACLTCKRKEFRFLEAKDFSWTTVLCGRNAVQITPSILKELSLKALKEKLEKLGEVSYNDFLLQFKIDPYEMVIFPNGRVIVKGTTDKSVARGIYSKYLGN